MPPVRAVADGEVIFVSPPTQPANFNDNKEPLNYNPFEASDSAPATLTDVGCVVIRHTTEIGASGGQPTPLVYYSLYMHLSDVGKVAAPSPDAGKRPWKAGDAIWRKDEIGTPGQIYGAAGQIHFEICMDEANLSRLLGRAPSWTEPGQLPAPPADGRTDAVFGAICFYVPASTPAANTEPTVHTRQPSAMSVGQALWVRMAYRQGGCRWDSFDAQGKFVGGFDDATPDIEHALYDLAKKRHNALSAVDQAKSSPSGWYELLRFGRNLGRGGAAADKDPLPSDAAHWRRITGPSGQPMWADLNAKDVRRFSDADFPPVMGWNCINDDSSPKDQRCDSDNFKRLIRDPDPAKADRMQPEALMQRMGDAAVQARMQTLFVEFPCEWDKGTVTDRYGFVQQLPAFQKAPNAWPRIKAHLEAICFDGLPQEFKNARWHAHPHKFITQLRQCGWLSEKEFVQLLPSHAVRTGTWKDAQGAKHAGVFWEKVTGPGPRPPQETRVRDLIANHRIPLNRALRKWGINTPLRQASFFGNAVQESSWLSSFEEGNGSAAWYAPWYGRGFLQLTHADNYIKYWRYRGRTVPQALEQALQKASAGRSNAALQDANFPALTQQMKDWRYAVEGDPNSADPDSRVAPSDSAAFYAAMLMMNSHADKPHVLQRQAVATVDNKGKGMGNKIYYRSPAFWEAAACVNLPSAISRTYSPSLNGFDSRCSAYGVALAVLTETKFPDAHSNATVEYPEGYSPRRTK